MNDENKIKPGLVREFLKMRQKVGELELFKAENMRAWSILNKFKILFSEINDLAYICDSSGNIQYVNEVFERITGFKPEEFIGKSFAPLFDEDNLKIANDAYTRTLRGERVDYELCFKDTGLICEFKNIPMRDEFGKITGVLGIARDITERKRKEVEMLQAMEGLLSDRTSELIRANEQLLEILREHENTLRALSESENKYKKLLETANDAVVISEADTGVIIFANMKAAELTGFSVESLIGMNQAELHPKKEAEFYLNDLKNESLIADHFYIRHRNGFHIPVEISSNLTEVDGKKFIHGIFRDISWRKSIIKQAYNAN